MHQIAEETDVPFDLIDQRYAEIEKIMLDRFFEFVVPQQHFRWVHWNMRDSNYGFAAIEHRHRVLKGEPIHIPEDRKFDLARAMVDIYGVGYLGHPRLESLIIKNKITAKDFLSGADEAAAFDRKEFVRLHQSTLRKVDILATICQRAANSALKTHARWVERYGFKPIVIAEVLKEHWVVTSLVVFGGVLTFVLRTMDLWEKIGN